MAANVFIFRQNAYTFQHLVQSAACLTTEGNVLKGPVLVDVRLSTAFGKAKNQYLGA